MNNSKDSSLRWWVLIFGVLLILSIAGIAVVMAVKNSVQQAQQAFAPVSDLSNSVGTQVAQLLHPTPTVIPDPVTIIQEVRSLARLETIQYSVEKVITAETGQGTFGFLFGDRLLFVAHGIVIAGVDLEDLRPEDLRLEDGVLYINMPEPEIFIATLDNEKSYVYDRNTGVLSRGDVNLETTARRAAEQEIANAAREDGILEMAGQNAERYLESLFLSLGYNDVIFIQPTPQAP
ncbi:MAG: DUF4230 domain-containing protein [Chloroflexi bacterium]|nr:MAG: DUF4230 domain-containing protein [Chloroflexota bacterium]